MPVNPLLWRLPEEKQEILQAGDILAIHYERPERQTPPPVHIPTGNANFRPSAGEPSLIRENGEIKLLGITEPVHVAGLTVSEAEDKLNKALQKSVLYQPGEAFISVMLYKRLEHEILVIREDLNRTSQAGSIQQQAQAQTAGTARRAAAQFVRLESGKNDLWHALEETGGRPGLDTNREILIYHDKFRDEMDGRGWLQSMYCPPNDFANDPAAADPSVTRIPVYITPGEPSPEISIEDITLRTGDIVVITARPLEVYYTAGLLGGGQFPLPQDRDLDVLEALASAGGSEGSLSQSSGLGFGGSVGTGGWLPPTWAIIVRKVPDYGTISIKTDLKRAMDDPRERILIQPNDIIYLKYKPHELIANILFRNVSGNVNVNDIFQ